MAKPTVPGSKHRHVYIPARALPTGRARAELAHVASMSVATHALATHALSIVTTTSTNREGKRALHTRDCSSKCMPTFIVAGQSNALGMGGDLPRATVNESAWSSSRVWGFGMPGSSGRTQCQQWSRYTPLGKQHMFCHQLDSYKGGMFGPGRTIGGPGAEATFALDMLRVPSATRGPGCGLATPDRVGIVKAAVIASGIRSWVPPENTTSSNNIAGYFEALVRNSMRGDGLPTLAELDSSACASVLGMLWVQGEADARKDRTMTAELWLQHLGLIRATVVNATGNPDIALVVARIRNRGGDGYRRIRSAQEAVATALPRTEMVDMDDLPFRPDGEHLTAHGLVTLGQRAANTMRVLLHQHATPLHKLHNTSRGSKVTPSSVDFGDHKMTDHGRREHASTPGGSNTSIGPTTGHRGAVNGSGRTQRRPGGNGSTEFAGIVGRTREFEEQQ